jgi:multidrug efflux system outer membrane protein
MSTEVVIKTGERSFMAYLMAPISRRLFESLGSPDMPRLASGMAAAPLPRAGGFVCRASLALAMVLAGGCSQVGDYQRPDSTIPGTWQQAQAPGGMHRQHANPVAPFFQDPRLQGLIANALDYNSDLRMALARVSETRAQFGIAGADQLPSVNLGADKTKSKIAAPFTGTDRPVTTERNEIMLTAVSFELDFWGRVASLSDAAKSGYLASEWASRAMRIALVSEVANLYFSLLELDERVLVARAAIESRKKEPRPGQARNGTRRGRPLGRPACGKRDAPGPSELAVLENLRSNAEHALLLLVGKPPSNCPPEKSCTNRTYATTWRRGFHPKSSMRGPT